MQRLQGQRTTPVGSDGSHLPYLQGGRPMMEPMPEWGPAEREARRVLNALRLELPPAVANDAIALVLAAFAELRVGVPRADTGPIPSATLARCSRSMAKQTSRSTR
jgi:hypothetical protein